MKFYHQREKRKKYIFHWKRKEKNLDEKLHGGLRTTRREKMKFYHQRERERERERDGMAHVW